MELLSHGDPQFCHRLGETDIRKFHCYMTTHTSYMLLYNTLPCKKTRV